MIKHKEFSLKATIGGCSVTAKEGGTLKIEEGEDVIVNDGDHLLLLQNPVNLDALDQYFTVRVNTKLHRVPFTLIESQHQFFEILVTPTDPATYPWNKSFPIE